MTSKSLHTRIIYIGILFVSLFFRNPSICLSEIHDAVGKVVALRGQAMAIRQGEPPRNLAYKSPIFQKDTIQTQDGRLQIMFTDNTLITLGRQAEMVMEEYMWQKGDSASTLHTRIRAGSFRVMGGAITRDAPMNFKTEAPSATIGIRGSMYAGIVKESTLSVVYQGGKGIYVSNPMGRVEIDRPGFGTIVTGKEKAPSLPVKFDKAILEEIESGMAATDQEREQGKEEGDGQAGQEAVPAEEEPSNDFGSDSSLQSESSPALPGTVTDILLDKTRQDLEEETVTEAANELDPSVLDLLAELGFTGVRSTRVPISGIWVYKGISRDDDPGIGDDGVLVIVNWHSRRFIAFEKAPGFFQKKAQGFALGEITETGGIQNVRLFGAGDVDQNMYIYAFTGSEAFGHLYGSSQEAMIMALSGTDYPLHKTGSLVPLDWSGKMAAIFDKEYDSSDSGKPWNGFFIGLGENMNNIDKGRVSFINDDASDFSITFDRDSGTFSGTMTGYDILGSGVQVINLSIGGDKIQSVYITDDMIGAKLGGTHVISNRNGSTDLKPYGNYMFSSMETPLSENTEWGYWEMAYNEPGAGDDYHVHIPNSVWIAGYKTPASTVQSMIDSQAAGTLTYAGGALGIKIDSTVSPGMSQVSQLTHGTTSMDVDFNDRKITGSIDFSEITLPVSVAAVDFLTTGFKGTVFGASSSEVNGTFFGDRAQGLGGNFSAQMGGVTFQGIFAGDR